MGGVGWRNRTRMEITYLYLNLKKNYKEMTLQLSPYELQVLGHCSAEIIAEV